MRTFALLAFLAAYASGTELKGDDATADVKAEADAASDAVDAALEDASKDVEAASDAVDGEAAKGDDAGKAVTDEDLAASIDGALAQANENGEQKRKNPQDDEPVPDNYRPPPKQNVRRKERRERPNIHNHPLLKSMDLSFVGGFNDGRAKK